MALSREPDAYLASFAALIMLINGSRLASGGGGRQERTY